MSGNTVVTAVTLAMGGGGGTGPKWPTVRTARGAPPRHNAGPCAGSDPQMVARPPRATSTAQPHPSLGRGRPHPTSESVAVRSPQPTPQRPETTRQPRRRGGGAEGTEAPGRGGGQHVRPGPARSERGCTPDPTAFPCPDLCHEHGRCPERGGRGPRPGRRAIPSHAHRTGPVELCVRVSEYGSSERSTFLLKKKLSHMLCSGATRSCAAERMGAGVAEVVGLGVGGLSTCGEGGGGGDTAVWRDPPPKGSIDGPSEILPRLTPGPRGGGPDPKLGKK